MAPNPLSLYSLAQLKDISDYALKHDYFVHIHFDEDQAARKEAFAVYGLTPIELISQAGLSRNKIALAYGVDLIPSELDQLARHTKVSISHNPRSNEKLSGTTAAIPDMLGRDITVDFGTDGAASSNSLDLFSQINFAAYGFLKCQAAQKYCKDGYSVDLEKLVRMATIDGAKVGIGFSYRLFGSWETSRCHFT